MLLHRIKHWLIQFFRRTVQVGVILGLFALIFLSLYAHYRAARALEDVDGATGKIFARLDDYVEQTEDPQAFLDSYKGTLWSMMVAGVDLTDPLAAVEMTAASHTLYFPLLLSALIPVIVTLILGKVFCSWVCPAYVIFEIAEKFRKVLRFAEIPPANVKFSHNNKYFILFIGLIFAALVGMPLFAFIYPPAVISRLLHAWVFGTALTGMLILMGLMVVFEVFVSPRWWCRTMCPGGALYGLIGAKRLLRVKLKPDKCNHCRKCRPVCPAGIDPEKQSAGIECDNCGVCIRDCPQKALGYGITIPLIRRKNTSPANTSITHAVKTVKATEAVSYE